MSTAPLTLQQFGQQIKAKYPAYASKSDEEVGRAMLAKYPQYASRVKIASTPEPGFLEPHGKYSVGDFLRGTASSFVNPVLHPIDTLKSAFDEVRSVMPSYADVRGVPLPVPNPEAIPYASSIVKEAAAHPAFTAGEYIGPVLVGAGVEKIGNAVPRAAGRVGEALTKTGPRETANLVKETKQANEAEAARVAKENEEQAAKRKVDLRKHFDKTQATKQANVEAGAPATRRQGLERGVEHLEPELSEQLEATERRVNGIANDKYNALVKVLKDEQAAPYQPVDADGHIAGREQTITEHLYDVASEPLRGTETESTIIKSLGKRVESGETTLSYNDLQGYREEIGKELRKGTLAPDTFTAYKRLMPEIDRAMQEIANRKGLGPAQADARNYYRQYAETFLDRDSAVRRAIDTSQSLKRKPADVVASLRGRSPAIEALARYNPDLARRINTVAGYQAEGKSIPAKPKALKSLPHLSPKPEAAHPQLRTVGVEDIRAAKEKGLAHRASRIRSRGEWIATGAAGYRALSNILHGNLAAVPPDLFEGVVAVAGVEGIARLLEKPSVVEFLTRPTVRDIAEVPTELRGDMGEVAKIAAKKGIKVDPRLYTVPSIAPKRRVAAALQP
jgi:hypothetical protein